ncbi:hypothetical protein MMC28_006737 [Mycoblastus sanguinarius]|nr:hypothetical protein [Mycoblastus sanguinarius]
MWLKTPIPGVYFDAIGLIALADLATIAQHTALNGTSSFLDSLILCPGIHRQQHATEVNKGELPATAALTSGYVFRIENQATVFYLQRMGRPGHLVTLKIEEPPETEAITAKSWVLQLFWTVMKLSFLLYIVPILLSLLALLIMFLMDDEWGLAALLILISARVLNIIVIRRRSKPGWKGVKEPGVKGDLLVLLSQDRWLRLRGSVDALKAVTAGQWLRDTTFFESSLTAIATLLVYANVAVTSNVSQFGQIVILALLLLSLGMLPLSDERTDGLHMHGCIIQAEGKPRAYARRLDLADELIKYTGRDDWAIRLGMINHKPEDGDTVQVML